MKHRGPKLGALESDLGSLAAKPECSSCIHPHLVGLYPYSCRHLQMWLPLLEPGHSPLSRSSLAQMSAVFEGTIQTPRENKMRTNTDDALAPRDSALLEHFLISSVLQPQEADATPILQTMSRRDGKSRTALQALLSPPNNISTFFGAASLLLPSNRHGME